jgi:hypothetical protein
MSYLNFNTFHKHNLLPEDLYYLLAVKQIEKEQLKNIPIDVIERFEALGIITMVKGKKGDSEASKIRLNDKGKDLAVKLSFEGSPDEETEIIANWLINTYKDKKGGIVKNKTEIRRRIMWFKTITDIRENRLAVLLQCFLSDCFNEDDGLSVKEFMEQNPRGVLSNMLDNVFFSPTSVFDKHKTLDKSPLYTYYEDNKEYVNQIWESKGL